MRSLAMVVVPALVILTMVEAQYGGGSCDWSQCRYARYLAQVLQLKRHLLRLCQRRQQRQQQRWLQQQQQTWQLSSLQREEEEVSKGKVPRQWQWQIPRQQWIQQRGPGLQPRLQQWLQSRLRQWEWLQSRLQQQRGQLYQR